MIELPEWWGSDKPYRIEECLSGLKSLPDGVIQCCITSPPYWGLRDYGTGKWEGGSPNCDHSKRTSTKIASSTLVGTKDTQNHEKEGWLGGVCGKCGARKIDEQIGLERTPEEYVAKIVEVFHEVKRILRDDGTLWLNLGDSYVGGGRAGKDGHAYGGMEAQNRCNQKVKWGKPTGKIEGLKTKDLVGIPWMVAFALRADGWYLRQDIIWHKPNPMPESVTDRCTKAHEYIFLLSKSQKYYYDNEAIKEKGVYPAGTKGAKGSVTRHKLPYINGRQPEYKEYTGIRNKRDVWTITTKPYKNAHFATFPPDLPEICIKAGTSQKGACSKCGSPWERIIEHTNAVLELSETAKQKREMGLVTQIGGKQLSPASSKTIGWNPTCSCGINNTIPCVVIDPFLGSGTVIKVALKHGRQGLGFDIQPNYAPLIEKRIDKEWNEQDLNDWL